MFTPRHPKPLLSTRAVATQVVQQKQGSKAMDKHVLIVDTVKPAAALSVIKKRAGSHEDKEREAVVAALDPALVRRPLRGAGPRPRQDAGPQRH